MRLNEFLKEGWLVGWKVITWPERKSVVASKSWGGRTYPIQKCVKRGLRQGPLAVFTNFADAERFKRCQSVTHDWKVVQCVYMPSKDKGLWGRFYWWGGKWIETGKELTPRGTDFADVVRCLE